MKTYKAHIVLITILTVMVSACSTKKNTSGNRFYHSMTARFNTYFNGSEAFKEGIAAQEDSHKDNYTELLPIFTIRNKSTASIGKGNFETAIEKCEKAIKRHSIKARPKMNVNKKKSDKDKAFLARKEFNPFLKNAWMLMGKSQFQQGLFIEAASTFNYIIALYAGQPDIVSEARAHLARCYIELEWPYDAEDVLKKMTRDSMSSKGEKEYAASSASYFIFTEQYKEAIPHLQKTIKEEKNKRQRARLNYLLAQLQQKTGNKKEAYDALKKVIRANPPYELSFNAQIQQSEVMSEGNHKKTIKKLQRMARNKKNKDYQDRIYYAIGNIYWANNDTINGIFSYEEGVKKSTQKGYATAMLLLRLCDIYWEKENYIEAQRCYAELISVLDKEHEHYKEAERRSTILTELEPHLSSIKLQDSLQWLAKLPEDKRLVAIDRVIEELKKKEKEEAKAEMDAMLKQNNTSTTSTTGQNTDARGKFPAGNQAQSSTWYFYNPSIVAQGKRQFARIWGNRPLEDNWRRSHKSEDKGEDYEEADYEGTDINTEMADSIATADSIAAANAALTDSLAQDPHNREFYLQQIPFSEEQIQASNEIIKSALYQAGIIEMEKLENFPRSRKTLLRLLESFPEVTDKDNVYYHLFLINGRLNQPDEAEHYKQLLINEFPESKYSILLSNPNYEQYAKYGKQIEDSLYAATYKAYLEDAYQEVFDNYALSEKDFPEGANRARFMFLQAMSQLYSGQQDSFLVVLKSLVEKYPKEEITQLAESIVKGINEGRSPTGGKMDIGDLWSRHNLGATTDSTLVGRTFTDDKLCDFIFMLAYPTDSINENQLLYEMALYNFTNFTVRNFEMDITTSTGISQLQIKGFNSFDEAHAYAQKLYADPHMNRVVDGLRGIIISANNLSLLGTLFSYDDYKTFYDEKLAPTVLPEQSILDEPEALDIRTEDDYIEEEMENTDNYNSDEEEDSGIIF